MHAMCWRKCDIKIKIHLVILVLSPTLVLAQNGPINVHLKTGDILSTQYALLTNNSFLSRPFVRIHDKKGEKITIDRVIHVEGTDQNGQYKFFKPIQLMGSEIWGERTFHSERVDIYYTDVVSFTGASYYKSKYFQYSKDSRPLKKLNYSNLKIDLADNAGSMQHVERGNKLRITQLLLYGLGAGLVVAGAADILNDDELDGTGDTSFSVPPTLIVGAIALNIPWFINPAKDKHFVNALEEYN